MSAVRLFTIAILAGACDFDAGPAFQTKARFVNALPGLNADIGFLHENTFVSGSVVPFAGVSAACSKLKPRQELAALGFGVVNPTRTGLSGAPLIAGNFQGLQAGMNYTLIAAGTAEQPHLFVPPNGLLTALPFNQASVTFANLVPTAQTADIDVLLGSNTTPTPQDANLRYGTWGGRHTLAAGINTFTIRNSADNNVLSNESVTLVGNSESTIAILPTLTGGYQWLHIPSC